MIKSSFFTSVLYLLLITGVLSILYFPVKATAPDTIIQISGNDVAAFSFTTVDSLHLAKQKVGYWIKTRIAVAKLQNRMKANAAEYDNVIQSFYAEREVLLKSRGWSVQDFDVAKNRIHAAISAMDIADELAESKADHEKEIADVKANEYYNEEQKKEMINALGAMREQKRKLYIEPTKPDWPAVRPHRSVFRHMSSWAAGNRADPPVLD